MSALKYNECYLNNLSLAQIENAMNAAIGKSQ